MTYPIYLRERDDRVKIEKMMEEQRREEARRLHEARQQGKGAKKGGGGGESQNIKLQRLWKFNILPRQLSRFNDHMMN